MTLKPSWNGRFYEDFEVDDVYQHTLGRTISEVDNTWLTLLTMNTNPMHFDANYASKSEFGQLLVNSGVTVAIVLGMSVSDTTQNAFANLGWEDIQLTSPVYIGDTLYAETKVTAKRESASRPHAGIVSFLTRGLNQNGGVVMSYKRSAYIYKRAAGEAQNSFPVAQQDWPDESPPEEAGA
jgi:itaconyl-CoA hydratase